MLTEKEIDKYAAIELPAYLQTAISKAKVLGTVKEFKLGLGEVYVLDDGIGRTQICLRGYIDSLDLTCEDNKEIADTFRGLTGDIAVISYAFVGSTEGWFKGVTASTIDLACTPLIDCVNTTSMFEDCKVDRLYFNGLWQGNRVLNADRMFCNSDIKNINFDRFEGSRLETANEMFKGCKASHIGLKSFKPKNLLQCEDMFLNCNADILTSAESLNLIYNRLHKERVRPR